MLRFLGRAVGLGGGRAPPRSAPESSCSLAVDEGCWEAEEWEFVGYEDEEEQRSCAERVEFESLPSQEEVEEAAFVLHLLDSHTRVVHPFSGSQDYETAQSSNSVQQSSDLLEGSTSLESDHTANENAVDWTEPELHPCNCEVVQQLGHNNVFGTFQLLQTNPAVQEMVISVASDKAVWEAVSEKERVLEFKQLLQKEPREITRDSDEVSIGKLNFFIWVAKNAKTKLTDYKEKITELISIILRFADKRVFAEEDGDVLDRTLKPSLLLSIVVLFVFVVKESCK